MEKAGLKPKPEKTTHNPMTTLIETNNFLPIRSPSRFPYVSCLALRLLSTKQLLNLIIKDCTYKSQFSRGVVVKHADS